MAYLYILKLRDNTHYCGIARNIVKRIQQHQKGRSKSTRLKLPVVLKLVQEYPDMSEARIMEVRIKSQGVTRWWMRNNTRTSNIVTTISIEP